MVNVRNYNPIWPEVIVWWGAGASKSLNLLTTDDIAKQITILAKEDSLKARIDDIYSNESDEIKEDLKRLLNFFESPSDLEEDIKIKQNYDWESLKKVINISPKVNDYVPVQELFNILDMSIQNRLGFTLPNGKLLEVNQLSAAREMLKLLIIFLQSIQYKKLIKGEKEKVNPYYEFARAISQLMIEEGLALKDEAPLNNRLFYLESLAFICLNWDPILLWMLFYSNREMNHSSGGSYIGENCEKLKLYQEQVSRYKSIEDTLKETLITAQAAAEDTCAAANKQAKSIVGEAELKSKQIIADCNDRIVALRKEYDSLVKEFKVFRNRFKSLIQDEIKNIDEIFSDVDESCKEPFATAELSNDRSYLLAEDEAASAME